MVLLESWDPKCANRCWNYRTETAACCMGSRHRALSDYAYLKPYWNKSVFSCNVTLLAFAAERRPCSNQLISPVAGPTAANPPQRRAAADWWDGRTARRTLDSFINPAPRVRKRIHTRTRIIAIIPEHRTLIYCNTSTRSSILKWQSFITGAQACAKVIPSLGKYFQKASGV